MNVKLMTVVAALLASTSAWAQGASEQTSQDLVCQLADTCPAAAEEDEADEADVVATPAPATPGARISATRGFKIASKVDATTTSKPSVAQPRAGAAKPKARVTAVQTKRATAPGKGIKTAAVKTGAAKAASGQKAGAGRADLRVSFVTGSAHLTDVGQGEAMKFADALQSPLLSGMRFRIEGHTDAVGNREYNLDLSRQRAQAVVDYLAGKGVDRARFDVAGYGFDKPLAGTQRTSAANRRVEVVRIK